MAGSSSIPSTGGGKGLPRAPPVTSSKASWPCWLAAVSPAASEAGSTGAGLSVSQAGQLCRGVSYALWDVE